MVLYIAAVSEHGRMVLVAVGQCSCVLTLLATMVLRAMPPPPPAAVVLERLFPRAAYPPVVAMRSLLEGWRPGLHVLAASSDVAAVVVAVVLLVVGGRPCKRRARHTMMAVAHWTLGAELLLMVLYVLLWVIVASWSGIISISEATERWEYLATSYYNDPAAHAAVDDIQFFLGCCDLGGGEDIHEWLDNNKGIVPPSCCRPRSHLPCLYEDLLAYKKTVGGTLGQRIWWRRVLPHFLHMRACPGLAFHWVRERAKHVLLVLFMIAAQHVLLAGLAVSALHNSALNRDPLAPAPATAFRNRFGHPLAMTQF